MRWTKPLASKREREPSASAERRLRGKGRDGGRGAEVEVYDNGGVVVKGAEGCGKGEVAEVHK